MTLNIFLKKIKRIKYIFLLLLVSGLNACEDLPTFDYEKKIFVEAFLITGKSFDKIKIMYSQSVTDTFKYKSGDVKDAEVIIYEGSKPMKLRYKEFDDGGYYYYPDTNTVKPLVQYRLEVKTSDGKVATATTIPPAQIAWTKEPFSSYNYPLDTINLPSPDSLSLGFTENESNEYLISVRCLDTLGYGEYLSPKTSDSNSRIYRFINSQDPFYDDMSRWGYLTTNTTPLVWFIFKWYGANEISVYAADQAMVKYFKQLRFAGANPSYEPTLSNITGGVGVFGSASILTKRTFLYKNK